MVNVYTITTDNGWELLVSAFCAEQAGMTGGIGAKVQLDNVGQIHNQLTGYVDKEEDDVVWVRMDCHCYLPYSKEALEIV